MHGYAGALRDFRENVHGAEWRNVAREGHPDVVEMELVKFHKKPECHKCSSCKYSSTRLFNVRRHEQRIHKNLKRARVCCATKFLTKGEYYLHCEEVHPETRAHSTVSRTKYKILSDVNNVALQTDERTRRRLSQRIRKKKTRSSRISFKYSVSYKGLHYEDIPLIHFVKDGRLSCLKKSKKFANAECERGEQDVRSSQAPKSDFRTEEEINDYQMACVNNDSLPSSASFNLPVKKLILHRFTTTVNVEIQEPLREKPNNEQNKVVKISKRVRKITKRSYRRENKENQTKFDYGTKEQLKVHLDNDFALPFVTQLHREFLSSIDFDTFKIY